MSNSHDYQQRTRRLVKELRAIVSLAARVHRAGPSKISAALLGHSYRAYTVAEEAEASIDRARLDAFVGLGEAKEDWVPEGELCASDHSAPGAPRFTSQAEADAFAMRALLEEDAAQKKEDSAAESSKRGMEIAWLEWLHGLE